MTNGLQMKYFVLKPKGDFDDPYANASRVALKAYAKEIEEENSKLCYEIKSWVIEEQGKANEAHLMKKMENENDDT